LSRLGTARVMIDSDSHEVLNKGAELKQCELYQDTTRSSATIFVLDGEPRILLALPGFWHQE